MVDNATLDVTVKTAGGYADVAPQEEFCFATRCVFWKIYDQSGKGNHLTIAPPGGADPHWDAPADAAADPLKVGGHDVYGLRMDPPSGYRCDNTTGIAVGDEAETMYAVFNGSHFNNACCFDCASTVLYLHKRHETPLFSSLRAGLLACPAMCAALACLACNFDGMRVCRWKCRNRRPR